MLPGEAPRGSSGQREAADGGLVAFGARFVYVDVTVYMYMYDVRVIYTYIHSLVSEETLTAFPKRFQN